MKLPRLLIGFIVISLNFATGYSQNEYTLLQKEFPKLSEKFGNELKKQSATYVFAIDVSTSMKQYEGTIKNNIEIFINSLPDNDFVTIVKLGRTEETGFVYIPNTPITRESKKAIINDLRNTPFNQQGSDGFMMATKVVEALDKVGSPDLKYVFTFTDYEYWTPQHGCDLSTLDWNGLASKFRSTQTGKQVKVVGIELPIAKRCSDYRPKLNSIFGTIDYLTVSDKGSLENWFSDTKASILRDRLRFVFNKAFKKAMDNFHLSCSTKRNQIHLGLYDPEGIIDSVVLDNVSFVGKSNSGCSLEPLPICIKPNSTQPFVSIAGSNLVKQSMSLQGEVVLDGKVYPTCIAEVSKLGISPGKINTTSNFSECKVMVGEIPLWVAALIAIVLLWFIGCILYTCFRTITFTGNLVVTRNGNTVLDETIMHQKKIALGAVSGRFNIPSAEWTIIYRTEKNCPCLLFKKAGLYLYVEKSVFPVAVQMTPSKSVRLSKGQKTFLPVKNKLVIIDDFEIQLM